MDELNGSELGTRTYWETTYKEEINNYEKHGDMGEVWFGEDSVDRIVQWMCKCKLIQADSPIIDVGCGNGYSLIELAREGYTNLLGIDYSEEAIKLAQRVSKDEFPNIQYQVFDITTHSADRFKAKFQVAHDKGTYDAISLNPVDPKTQRELYIEKVSEVLKDDGLFIITSCNWTDTELANHFEGNFTLKTVIPTPQFKFGGKVGNVVSSAVFVKCL